jgi:hypothetical protein
MSEPYEDLEPSAEETFQLSDKAIDYILAEFRRQISGEPKLTKWEISFIESIADQWEKRRKLSERQKEILGEIWDKN